MGDALRVAGYPNVIPVIDQGELDDHWIIVMPRAETSLQSSLKGAPPPLSMDQLLPILRDIADGLAGLHGNVVHRDLKPANVLYFNGAWCLADFGIARYADAATATETHKYSLSVDYAAPEQWRLEHATGAADVYAFGVIGYLLIEGRLPFLGPTTPDFRHQHCNEAPPPFTGGTARLRDLITECLIKAPEARPTPAAIVERLKTIAEEPTVEGFSKLAALNTEVVRDQAEQLRIASIAAERQSRLQALAQAAVQLLTPVGNSLFEAIRSNAPAVQFSSGEAAKGRMISANLLGAHLILDRPVASSGQRNLPFTVIAESRILVARPNPNLGWLGRSHSLWYCDAYEENQFAWYELAFMASGFGSYRPEMEPFSLTARDARDPFSNVIGTDQLAWPIEEINRTDPTEFLGRWLGWFADAANGSLSRPGTLPERVIERNWRH